MGAIYLLHEICIDGNSLKITQPHQQRRRAPVAADRRTRATRQLAGASDPENFTGNQDFYLTAEASSSPENGCLMDAGATNTNTNILILSD
jgi:hypothetical protein